MHEKQIEIRWRDMDAFGHVNNAVYLTYLEEVRDEWLERALAGVADSWDFVLVRVAIDYRSELKQSDDMLVARVGLRSIGRSSFQTREELRTRSGRVAASAESVMVARDRTTGSSRRLSADERSALEREHSTGGLV
jgi:acyl-CoA thioester hydrolase